MKSSTKNNKIIVAIGIVVVAAVVYLSLKGRSPDSSDSLNKYTIGIVTWVGYGPLYVAQEKGFFKDEGLKIDIKIMDGAGEREAAYLSGSLDLFPNTPDAFVIFATQGAKGKIVMPMDESAGADGVIAKKEIQTIADLKGKKVGFQSGITSHFFLLYLLDQAGLSGSDVKQENLGAGEAGAAFAAGNLDAAVTWEPWLTKANEMPEGKLLKTSKDTPGLLADVLMASDDMINQHRSDLQGFMRAWFKAVDYLKEEENESINIIAKAFTLESSEVKDMLSTDHFFLLDESKEYFGSPNNPGKVFEVLKLASRLYMDNKVIESIPDMNRMVDVTVLNGLTEEN